MFEKRYIFERKRIMRENRFIIRYNPENGGVDSIVNAADDAQMNWVHENRTWGTIKDAKVISVTETETGLRAVYETLHLRITVDRALCGDVYRESYTLENKLPADVFMPRAGFGIYTPFYDSNANAKISLRHRCNTHIWCGRDTSYINAVKMGPCDFALGLVVTEGSLDTYSIDRVVKPIPGELGYYGSDDRGYFILHPTPFRLRPNEKKTITWELFWYEDGAFEKALDRYPELIRVSAENYTVFTDEAIEFSVDHPDARVFLEDESLPTVTRNGKTFLSYRPTRTGDHLFTIRVGEKETVARFYVQLPLPELIKRRVEFIMDKQQFEEAGAALDGALLIYDNEEKRQVFDYLYTDHNACRERLVMGLLVVKYLQYVKDERLLEKFMKYYRFVTREFYDEETGEVYNNIGKHSEFKRLYNAPWMSVLVLEMYNLTGEKKYLEQMFKLLSIYYSIGGERFYPNGLSVYETVTALRKEGMTDEANALVEMYRKHAENIIAIGLEYPEHEAKYEQSIVAPAVNILCQLYMLTEDERLKTHAFEHLKVLERFNGFQPTHLLNDQAIRHWDNYWFGKHRSYGDTMPHAASVHTSNAFLHYAAVSGDDTYRKRAYSSARNSLSLFFEDGSASSAYVYPYAVNGVRCECYDAWANEQDGMLYYLIKFYGALTDGKVSPDCLRDFSVTASEKEGDAQ